MYDADQGVIIPIPGAPYSERLPAFTQLDVRVDKRFTFKSWILSIYIDVIERDQPRQRRGLRLLVRLSRSASAVTGLPILPSLGVRASF